MRDPVVAPVSRGRCAAELAGHPVSMGAATSIVLGALAIEAPLAMFPLLLLWMGTIWGGSRSARIQRAAARARCARQLSDRRDRREQRLVDAGAPRAGLQDATALVDEVSRIAPEDAALLELEDLLDRYADLAVDHARCCALALAHDRHELRARADTLARRGDADGMHLSVLARRIACADRCHEHIAVLDEALSDILVLLRLAAEQAALHRIRAEDTGGTEDAIAERLRWIDEDTGSSK